MRLPSTFVHGDQSLLDCLERLSRVPEGCRAVYIALSRLRFQNRSQIRLRIAASLFAPLVTGYGAEVFLLSNGDLVVVGRDLPGALLETHVERLRALFQGDPASRGLDVDGRDAFVTYHALDATGRDLAERVDEVRRVPAESWRTLKRTQDPVPQPMVPRLMKRVGEALARVEPHPMVQRQAVIEIDAGRRGHVAFEEFFVSIAELRRHCAPDVDIMDNRWLFQEFCRLLDKQMVRALARLERSTLPSAMAMNLNLETVTGPVFDDLARALPPDTRLLVEVQVIDAFANLSRLRDAAAILRARGDALVLDGVNARALGLVDLGRLDVDFVKVQWESDLAESRAPSGGMDPAAAVDAIGGERVILNRVESEAALLWGLTHGVRAFQGFFMDRMVGATTMAGCPKQDQCTLAQCVDRRRAAAGPGRLSCPNPPRLNAVTHLSGMAGRQAPAKGGADG